MGAASLGTGEETSLFSCHEQEKGKGDALGAYSAFWDWSCACGWRQTLRDGGSQQPQGAHARCWSPKYTWDGRFCGKVSIWACPGFSPLCFSHRQKVSLVIYFPLQSLGRNSISVSSTELLPRAICFVCAWPPCHHRALGQ